MTSQDPFRWLYEQSDRIFGPIIPDLVAPLIKSIGTAALDAIGLSPGLSKEWISTLESYVALNGQFTKAAMLYIGAHPPPVSWPYYCGRCRFWQEPDRCTMVKGDIYFAGWCSIWMPPDKPDGTLETPLLAYAWYLEDVDRLLADLPKFLVAPIGKEF